VGAIRSSVVGTILATTLAVAVMLVAFWAAFVFRDVHWLIGGNWPRFALVVVSFLVLAAAAFTFLRLRGFRSLWPYVLSAGIGAALVSLLAQQFEAPPLPIDPALRSERIDPQVYIQLARPIPDTFGVVLTFSFFLSAAGLIFWWLIRHESRESEHLEASLRAGYKVGKWAAATFSALYCLLLVGILAVIASALVSRAFGWPSITNFRPPEIY